MDAKVQKIPFYLRGKPRKLNEIIQDVTPEEMAHFGDYLKEIHVKTKKEEKDGKPTIKT